MMGPATRVGLAEPMHLVGAIRGVEVIKRRKGLKGRAGRLQPFHSGQNVDDRLGWETGNGGTADVVDAPGDPPADRLAQRLPLGREAAGPGRIVGRDLDRLVGV